jgi:hypothetical protein
MKTILSVDRSAQIRLLTRGRTTLALMEAEEYYDTEREDYRPRQWRWQKEEENYVTAAQNIRPSTTMGTMVKVEELMTVEERMHCVDHITILSQCGQTHWKICENRECYGCYFKKNAIVDLRTDDNKGETALTIGEWAGTLPWADATVAEKIEHIAIFLATKPRQRRLLAKLGAVRLTREEGRNIILKKRKAFNFFATVQVKKYVYLDDYMMPLDETGLGEANTIEFFIEYSTTHYAMVFDRIMERLNEDRVRTAIATGIHREDYSIIDDINKNTKANIMQSLLGLGQIFREQAFTELMDLPHIINYLETELRYHDMLMNHKQRGQHPLNYQYMEDYEVLTTHIQTGTTERLRKTPRQRGVLNHDMRTNVETMREEERNVVYGIRRGEAIPIISSGSEEETTRAVRQRTEQ